MEKKERKSAVWKALGSFSWRRVFPGRTSVEKVCRSEQLKEFLLGFLVFSSSADDQIQSLMCARKCSTAVFQSQTLPENKSLMHFFLFSMKLNIALHLYL